MEEEAARGEGRTRREILQEVIAKSKAYKFVSVVVTCCSITLTGMQG